MKEIIPRNSHDLFHNMKSNDFVKISYEDTQLIDEEKNETSQLPSDYFRLM